jgi:hypothetical protein
MPEKVRDLNAGIRIENDILRREITMNQSKAVLKPRTNTSPATDFTFAGGVHHFAFVPITSPNEKLSEYNPTTFNLHDPAAKTNPIEAEIEG